MAKLSASELRRYDWRPEVFIKKIVKESPFEVAGGKKVVLLMPKDGERILRSPSSAELNALRLADTKGGVYKGDRSDFGIKGTRVVIAPKGGRKITNFI